MITKIIYKVNRQATTIPASVYMWSIPVLVMLTYPAVIPAMPVVGWVEKVSIEPEKYKLRARMDTGANTSSIHASDVQIFDRGGKRFVSFLITNKRGRTLLLERPLIRHAAIRQDFGEPQKRPVIELSVCVGNIKKTIEVNINDRSGMNYPMLIGRTFLAGSYLVDSSRSFTTPPNCE
jgi:hypothetical protein